MMAVVGVLIWLDSTEGLTEEGALIIFVISLLVYFVMKLIGFFDKETQNKKRKSTESQKKT